MQVDLTSVILPAKNKAEVKAMSKSLFHCLNRKKKALPECDSVITNHCLAFQVLSASAA